jgi:hypothetical protein
MHQYGHKWDFFDKVFGQVYCVKTRDTHDLEDGQCVNCAYPRKTIDRKEIVSLFYDMFVKAPTSAIENTVQR